MWTIVWKKLLQVYVKDTQNCPLEKLWWRYMQYVLLSQCTPIWYSFLWLVPAESGTWSKYVWSWNASLDS
jgi:hypothetical protein